MLTVGGDNDEQRNRRAYFCPIRDVSLGGIRVSLHEALRAGEQIAVIAAFNTPSERVMRMGRVAWVKETDEERPFMTGLEFSDAGGARSHIWRDIMTRRYPQAVPPLSEAGLVVEPDSQTHTHNP